MRRIVVIALSVILALVVTMPMASGKPGSNTQNLSSPGQLKKLTAEWWNWAFATSPSPLEGSYTSPDPRCEGEYVEGVFFLAVAATNDAVERTCTVPANTPIFFPVVTIICSAAFDPIQEPDDPKPYHTKCAEPNATDTIEPPSTWFSTLDGQDLERQRIASGQFWWTIPFANNPFGLPTGTHRSATDGLWVYLEEGLTPGEHEIVFGGTYADTPFNNPRDVPFEGARVTYHLIAE